MHFGRASLLKLLPFVLVGALLGAFAMRAAHGTSMRGVILLLAMAILLALVAGVIWLFAVHNRRVAVAGDVQKRDALDVAPVAGKGVLYLYRSQYVAMLAGSTLSSTVDSLARPAATGSIGWSWNRAVMCCRAAGSALAIWPSTSTPARCCTWNRKCNWAACSTATITCCARAPARCRKRFMA